MDECTVIPVSWISLLEIYLIFGTITRSIVSCELPKKEHGTFQIVQSRHYHYVNLTKYAVAGLMKKLLDVFMMFFYTFTSALLKSLNLFLTFSAQNILHFNVIDRLRQCLVHVAEQTQKVFPAFWKKPAAISFRALPWGPNIAIRPQRFPQGPASLSSLAPASPSGMNRKQSLGVRLDFAWLVCFESELLLL